jgi:hypothetical protein
MAILPSVAAGAMHGAVVPIAYQKGTGTSGEVIFTNIPQIYQDLMLEVNIKSTNGAGYGYMYLNSFGSNQSYTALTGNGSSATSTRASGTSVIQYIPNSDQFSSTIPYTATMHFLNYANTSTYKNVLVRSAYDKNGSGGTQLLVGQYNVTGAITFIDLATFSGGANYTTDSTFALYGIRTVGQ